MINFYSNVYIWTHTLNLIPLSFLYIFILITSLIFNLVFYVEHFETLNVFYKQITLPRHEWKSYKTSSIHGAMCLHLFNLSWNLGSRPLPQLKLPFLLLLISSLFVLFILLFWSVSILVGSGNSFLWVSMELSHRCPHLS